VSSSLPNTIAAKAVALRVAQTSEFKGLQHRIQNNARAIAEVLSATGIPLYTGGTDSHLVVLRPDASIPSADNVRKLRRIGVLVNANPVPGDKPGRHNVTGIRLGTVWISQLGFDIHHSAKLAEIMARALTNHDPEELRRKVNSLLEEVLGGGSTHSCMPAK
jgi:glycine hydroxymethyltransferase